MHDQHAINQTNKQTKTSCRTNKILNTQPQLNAKKNV